MIKQIICISIVILGFLSVNAQTAKKGYWQTIPENTGWINDFEGIFTTEQENHLDSLVTNFEKRTSVEVAVITIPKYAVENDGFNDYVFELAKSWGVGKADKDNGILIGISKGHRSIWISNGIGIEKIMSDIETKAIIDNAIIPNFKNGNFYEGTFDGILEIIKSLDKEQKTKDVIRK